MHLPGLLQGFSFALEFDEACAYAHRGATVRMQYMWKELHSEVLVEETRADAPVTKNLGMPALALWQKVQTQGVPRNSQAYPQ